MAYDFFGKASARGKANGGLGLPTLPKAKPKMKKMVKMKISKKLKSSGMPKPKKMLKTRFDVK